MRRLLRPWFDLPLISKGMTIVSIPLVCVLFSAIAIHVFQQQREQLTGWIDRAFQAGQNMQSVINLLADAESGCRAFLLTRDEKLLEPFHRAERELPQRLDRLRAALQDSDTQMQRVERISDLSHRRMAALRAVLGESQPQLLTERIAQGQSVSEAIKHEFGGVAGEESRRWIAQIVIETNLRKHISVAVYGGAILSLLAGGFSMALFLTGIVRRSQMLRENAERLASGEPLMELASGADEIGRLGNALERSSCLLAAHEGELRKLNQELDLRVQERTSQLERETAERRRSEEQLRHAQKMEAIGRLAGGIAHDFNNALTLIVGFGDLLGETLPPNTSSGEYLGQMLRSAEHAASLTRQLLAFSRRQMIQPKLVDLNVVVTRMERLLSHLIGEDVLLRTQTAAHLESVLADEGQIEQVIMNLAVNARDAMPKGGNLTIRTDTAELDEAYCNQHIRTNPGLYVMLAVSDSGHGMTEDVQARIFEPFFTTKELGKGTGLGLSTVYGIVEQCGGTIWVYSEPGVGTTFKIYLPVANRKEPVREMMPLAVDMKSSATILLVEDEPMVRRMTRQILVRNGHTVLEAQDAATARSLCSTHGEIELLLTDVIMPKVNGFELSQELQNAYPALKVLYMSGYTDDALTRHAGVLDRRIDFIEKPFTPKGLCSKIRDVLGRHEQPV